MSAVSETRDRVSGQVAIATFNMGIPTLAVPLMQRLSTEEPNLRVQVQQDTSAAALRLLRQGEVDVAITCQYDFLGAESTGGLTTVPLLFEPLVLLAPTHSHLRIRKQGLSALADGFWVTGPQNSGLGIAALHA
ncbi:LysR substrate-binding domain-containing protein, partial [Mycobacteriaceae bacterium Msp059]|nr:LysR substrate-binding domain-containing protein [Mycobacteriaceae bacterium Msp059]